MCALARFVAHPYPYDPRYMCFEENEIMHRNAGVVVLDYKICDGIFKFEGKFLELIHSACVGIIHITYDDQYGKIKDTASEYCEYWPCGNCWQNESIRANNAWGLNDIVGLEINMQKRTLHFFVNGVLQPFSVSDIVRPVKIYLDLRELSTFRIISFRRLYAATVSSSTPVAPVPVDDWRTNKSKVIKWTMSRF
jgi:hypothetical protein